MKEIYINADDYNSDSIKTIQGNNNAEEYKIYLQYDNEKIDLTGKTVNLGFLRVGSTEGDIIENLNVTNPKEGEITLKITNKISKRNGTYSCQLAILGEGDFLEHTATFTLTVENNIFSDITKAIADSKDFTYLENILDKASKLSEKLKENTSSATNANSNLESNITEANNINSKLLENTSTATSLNKNLESNIDLAKEVKETIKDLDTKNIEATEKIEELTNLNNKAEELSNNINQALPINAELIKNTESAKVANTNLAAANQEAISKNTELQASLEKTKEFIDGLDGSQNIPGIRMELTELQNGLKSNQALAYTGSSISAENTLEGRTEGMRIGGRTLQNLVLESIQLKRELNQTGIVWSSLKVLAKSNTKYTLVFNVKKNTTTKNAGNWGIYLDGATENNNNISSGSQCLEIKKAGQTGLVKFEFTSRNNLTNEPLLVIGFHNDYGENYEALIDNIMLIEGHIDFIPEYFEGIKSFGEQEGNKISILSKSLNDIKFVQGTFDKSQGIIINVSTRITSNLIEGNLKSILNNNLDFKEFMVIIFAFDSDKRFISTTSDWADNLEISNLPTNTKYIRIVIKRKNEKTISPSDIANVYFGESDKKDILIKEPLRENDIMYEDNGQVKVYRDVKQYTFTGDESWIKSGLSDNSYSIFYINGYKPKGKIICNNFSYIDLERDKKEGICIIGDGSLRICINNNKLSSNTVEGFKTWLKANQTTIVYQLATPVVEVVDGVIDIDLDTFGEKTYFNILNSIKGSLDFKVPSNLGSSLQNLAKEVNNIWDVINNLLVPSIVKANGNLAMIKLNNNLK